VFHKEVPFFWQFCNFFFFVIPMKFYSLTSILPQINMYFLNYGSIEMIGYRLVEDLSFVVVESASCCF